MKNNLHKVLEDRLYIFLRASEDEIKRTLPQNWSEHGIYYVNCRHNRDISTAETMWSEVMG